MKRVRRIREQLSAHGADVFLCTNPVNRRYLTGFTVQRVLPGSLRIGRLS